MYSALHRLVKNIMASFYFFGCAVYRILVLQPGIKPKSFSLVTQMVKNLPAMQETQVPALGQEGPLEKGTATHSSVLAWEIPRTEEPGRLQSMGSQRV